MLFRSQGMAWFANRRGRRPRVRAWRVRALRRSRWRQSPQVRRRAPPLHSVQRDSEPRSRPPRPRIPQPEL